MCSSVGAGKRAIPTGAKTDWSTDRMEAFERLKKLLVDAEEDIKKAEGGNKAAGTRVRGLMQDIKAAAQEIREKILELRDVGDAN
jgi:hypothetical protein